MNLSGQSLCHDSDFISSFMPVAHHCIVQFVLVHTYMGSSIGEQDIPHGWSFANVARR